MEQIKLINNGPQGTYPINFFVDPEREDARGALIIPPGLEEWLDIGKVAPLRGMKVAGDYLYAVCGNTCYKITTAGTKTALSTTLDTQTGPVFMETNGTQLMIVDGSYGYIVTLSTGVLAKITDGDFPTPAGLAFQDTYFIVISKDTGRIYISANNDGTSWDALDYSTAEGNPDELVSLVSNNRELCLFGEITTEFYYNSGDTDFPFERISGAFIESGIASAYSAAKVEGSVFYLNSNRQICNIQSYQAVPVSTPMMDKLISRYTTINDAIGMGFVFEGHPFYMITFPSENKTWCYDLKTQLWHIRSSFPNLGDRYRANCIERFNGNVYVGDWENGHIYKMDYDTYTDHSQTIYSRHVFPPVGNGREDFIHNCFEIEMKGGVGLATGQGSTPYAMLDWSDDYQNTWSNELWREIGKRGNHVSGASWNALGRSAHREYRITISDPVERVIYAPYLDYEVVP